MPLVIADRVKETTTTTGTGTITLAGAATGFRSFSVVGNGNTTYYAIVDPIGGAWEVGIGTYSTTGPTLARTTVLSSSNSGSLVNFSAGTKEVYVTYPAGRSVFSDGFNASGTWGISISGNAATVTNGVYTSGSYADPAWITSLAGSKVSGNISGNAANVTGTVAVANGGTGGTTQAAARTGLGATTVGANLFTLTNPGAITFPRINADNTVSALDAATFRSAIGAGTSSTTGTVTSVSGTGTVSGLSLSGTVTSSGSLTLGGTLSVTPSDFSSQTGNTFLAAPNGSTGAPTFRAIVAADIPTLNQNTTGTASNITATSNSSLTTLSALSLPGSQVTGNISGNAGNVTGTVAVSNGGTGATSLTANAVLLGNGTSAIQSVAPGSSGNILTSNGTTWISQAPSGGSVNYQEFTSSGTWTKPSGATVVYVEVIAGGGGGANRTSGGSTSGGAGGEWAASFFQASALGSTVSVTIGAGGTGGSSSSNVDGGSGGDSSFGSHLTAEGGNGGLNLSSGTFYSLPGRCNSASISNQTQLNVFNLEWVTAGYGGAEGRVGGNAVLGGAGGGGGSGFGTNAGGTSAAGGNGGAGQRYQAGGNGAVPGGGGGGCSWGYGGGSGGSGRVRVWAW